MKGVFFKAVFFKAARMAFAGLLIGPGKLWRSCWQPSCSIRMSDPACGVGGSGGCAMGVVTTPPVVALPSMALFFIVSCFYHVFLPGPPEA
jgi:hypothetical protein